MRQRWLWSDWADAQADLSLRWAHTHFVCFVMSWLKKLWSSVCRYLLPSLEAQQWTGTSKHITNDNHVRLSGASRKNKFSEADSHANWAWLAHKLIKCSFYACSPVLSKYLPLLCNCIHCYCLGPVKRKRVFGSFRPVKLQTSLLSYRD